MRFPSSLTSFGFETGLNDTMKPFCILSFAFLLLDLLCSQKTSTWVGPSANYPANYSQPPSSYFGNPNGAGQGYYSSWGSYDQSGSYNSGGYGGYNGGYNYNYGPYGYPPPSHTAAPPPPPPPEGFPPPPSDGTGNAPVCEIECHSCFGEKPSAYLRKDPSGPAVPPRFYTE